MSASPRSLRGGRVMEPTRGTAPGLRGLLAELFTAGRFALVGIAATATHMLVVWNLVEAGYFPVLGANLVAFLTAFGVSFAGHYLWTFRAPGKPIRAMRRFFAIAFSAFAVNSALLAGLLDGELLPERWAAVLAAAVIPLITYLASRAWGFAR